MKLLSFLRSRAMRQSLMMTVAAAAPFAALMAATYTDEKGITWTYTIKNNETTVTKIENAVGDIVVPDSFDGAPVTMIGKKALSFQKASDRTSNETNVTSVTLPISVVKLENGGRESNGTWPGCFSWCTSLTNVVMPGVTYIGDLAFAECQALTRLVMPTQNVTYIGKETFRKTGLSGDFKFPELVNLGLSAFNSSKITSIEIPQITSLNGTFGSCTSLTNVVTPNVNYLYNGSFTGAKLPEVWTLPLLRAMQENTDNTNTGVFSGANVIELYFPLLTNIPRRAFWSTSKLVTLDAPRVQKISANAFQSASGLENLTYMPRLKTVLTTAFDGCSKLGRFKFPYVTEEANDKIFGTCSALTNLAFHAESALNTPEKIEALSAHTMIYGRSNPNMVVTIYGGACEDAETGTSWIYDDLAEDYKTISPTTVTLVGAKTLADGEPLSGEVVIPEKLLAGETSKRVTAIEAGAFADAENLTTVKIPRYVERVGFEAFENCSNLTTIRVWKDAPTAMKDALREEYGEERVREYSGAGLRVIIR